MYPLALQPSRLSPLVVHAQYCASGSELTVAAVTSCGMGSPQLNSVPPTATMLGTEAGQLTTRPYCASVCTGPKSQPVAPQSPAELVIVMPIIAAASPITSAQMM